MLHFMDGCHAGDYLTKYDTVAGTLTRSTSTPPVAGGAYYNMGSASSLRKNIPAASEAIFHIRVRQSNSALNAIIIGFYGDGGTTGHLSLAMETSTNKWRAYRGIQATALATGTTSVVADVWYDLQIRVTIADSGGIFQVRVNGNTTPEINYSGDTKNAGTNTTIDQIRLTRDNTSPDITDIVIMDTTGSYNNDWPGEVTVRTLTPNGNGNTSQMTGSDGNSTDNYLLVDEVPFSDSDYVGHATSAQGDTYTMTDLSGSPTVLAVQTVIRMGKSDAGAQQGKGRVRSGGTTYTGTTRTPATTYTSYPEVYETDPATSSPWTASNVNAVEVGAEVA